LERVDGERGFGSTSTDEVREQLWSLIPAEKRDEYLAAGNKKDTVPVLDLLPLGYSKVLGKGRIPSVPLLVRARWFSKEAERKITEAGGVVELVA
jgi:large subunit ribosomal protein L27Ae